MVLRPQERLPVVSRFLESALVIAQLFLVPGLVVFGEVGLFSMYLGPREILRSNWALTVSLLALFAVHLVVIRLPTVRGGFEKVVGRMKRRAVLSCPWLTTRGGTEWRPACWLIPEEYKQPMFRYDSQQNLIEQIVLRLSSDEEGSVRFVYIEGESGQGKTRTVFLLIHALLRHPKLFELANRAFLYDMAVGDLAQMALSRRIDTIEHEDALVFVDNFHRVEPDVLRNITNKLLDTPARNTERLVVLLGQPSQAWRVRPTAEIRLITTARSKAGYFTLRGVPSDFLLEEMVGLPGADIWRNAFGSATTKTATVAQLHFAQAVARNANSQLVRVTELLELIEGASHVGKEEPADDDLSRFVATVTALSLHRGNFTKRDFWSVCWSISPHRRWALRLLDCIRIRLILRRMSQLGFTPRLSAPTVQFVFHEAMAEHCKDRLEANQAFWRWFVAAVEWRLTTRGEKDPMVRWLLRCELHDTDAMERIFEPALLKGTLSPMVRCLDRNWTGSESSAIAGYQYALLLDKAGRFNESRRIFSRLGARSLSETVFADRVQLARVEVEHSENSYATLRDIAQRGDTANVIASEYWRFHLDAHRGSFRPQDLTDLAERLSELFSEDQFERSYFLLHSAARIFFDAHRHVYLAGADVEQRVLRLRGLSLEAVLRRLLPQFRAYSILYREAHLLAHEMLPNLVFFGSRPQLGSLVGKMRDGIDVSPRLVVKLALEAYSRARDEFAMYGDREYLYLQADILNLEMLSDDSDLEALKLKLIDYEAFVRKTGFIDMMSYPCFYFFRWYMLKYFRWLEGGDHRRVWREAEANLEGAHRSLKQILECDQVSGNRYGLWRATFLMSLLEGLSKRASASMVDSIAARGSEAEERGYFRDARLVQALLDQPKITPLDVRRIVLFFPFVHQ